MNTPIRIANHIALVGLGPDRGLHRDSPAEQVWGINTFNLHGRADLLFNMHDLRLWDERYADAERFPFWKFTHDSLERATAEGVPVLTCKLDPRYPCLVEYPIDAIIQRFRIDYFTCTVAYALAYAIAAGVERIDMYGITGSENYDNQPPCINYWIGHARGLGVEVFSFGEHSDLLRTENWTWAPREKQWRYGYAEPPEEAKALKRMLENFDGQAKEANAR